MTSEPVPAGQPTDRSSDPAQDRASSAADLLATVSHELRSPLTSIKGYTALLLSRWERIDDAEKKLMLAQVQRDADRVTRLVTDLLDVSRLESGSLDLRRVMVDLPALAARVLAQATMAHPELEATVSLPRTFPEAWADRDKIEQVLINLVENAVRHAGAKGVEIGGAAGEGAITVSVTDRGEGIPAADLDRLFDRACQRDDGSPSGTGLGLWISRGLIEAHGGELSASSVVGGGSTFRFTLPTRSDARAVG